MHDGLSTGRTYYYQGRAVDSAGVMSAWSEQVSATVLSTPNISAPTSFSAARGDEQVTLTWTAATAPAGQTIASYQYRFIVRPAARFADTPGPTVGNVTDCDRRRPHQRHNLRLRGPGRQQHRRRRQYRQHVRATPSTVPGAPTLTATGGFGYVESSGMDRAQR